MNFVLHSIDTLFSYWTLLSVFSGLHTSLVISNLRSLVSLNLWICLVAFNPNFDASPVAPSIMDRRDQEQRKSSLPSSLIPHLYTGPLHRQPNDSSTRSTLAPTLPAIAAPEVENIGPPLLEHTYAPPLSPSRRFTALLPLLQQTPIFEQPRAPPRYFNFEHRAAESPARHASMDSPPEVSDAILRLGDLSPIPPSFHDQPYGASLYADPHYHTSRPGMTLPTPGIRDPMLQRATWAEEESVLAHPVPREPFPQLSWGEGEAGPSSLYHPRELDMGRGRQGSSQPAPPQRMTSQPDPFDRGASRFEADEDFYFRGEHEGEHSYPPGDMFPSQAGMYDVPPSRAFHNLPELPPHRPASEDISTYPPGRLDPHLYPPVSRVDALSLSSSAPVSNGGSGHSPQLPAPLSERKKRKRRLTPEEDRIPGRRGHLPRKTAVACNFCRGRKLRCNGAKPACSNCIARKYDCEYVPIQRRRGPGKAPKRSRSKKGSASATGTPDPTASGSRGPEDRRSPSAADYGYEDIAPELRPYTSVMSLERFSFQPPESSPRYPGGIGMTMSTAMTLREQPGTPQSLETSSEDGTDEEDMGKNSVG
ncbi:hypothetical protein BDQ12DRAFT_680060 [Crucibulum laeve]|uniref:Zn(2)-C6 fungal-type domain-containing protein n=1 Tax=Crucibulum laeve TaxID=68775 RepID=A0A5C3M5U6_9AGAR|nr:hypothetical protein BDQ12DRAFT_680060 [Crucibulum laeve]